MKESEISNDIYYSDAIDGLERFTLWALNLGALREPGSQLSIEYRLAEDPDIRIAIHQQLDDFLEAIDDVATIVQGSQASYESKEDDKDMEHRDGFDDTKEEPSEVICTNFELISMSLEALFRIADLVRKANPSPPWQHAEDADCPSSLQTRVTGNPVPEALNNDDLEEPLQQPPTEAPAPAALS
ncbi:hypothetical protein CI102_9293 [Trichoderma harzianum]|uniref:Uncharacterized protein n=1 Tax=Trichoderma harzianum CBS 226.95 TaxID=983964 RepID=A0A2T4ABB6_TRIHA|nr:hypothetical protein M431DRAFT_6509 [Trichoderma harzianum CBS 226.95]PKK47029.1 hypothetical protein CI102_9293 [Trichoderma harzianum]PTB54293.1 hypothetical protein M431DRAFT_6509 [Trichoderma harzianum CBS 226.95]